MSVEAVLEASVRYDFPALAERTLSQASAMKLDGGTRELRVEPLWPVPRIEGGGG